VDRTKFIDDLIDAGASDDEIAEALSLAEERNEFNEAQSQTPQKTLSRFEQSLFPSISHTGEAGKALPFGQAVKDTFKGGLDLLAFPIRALGTLRGNDIKDSKSALLRPEMEKAKGAIDRMPEPPQIETNNTGKPPMFNPMGSFALQQGDKGYKDVLKGAVELGGNIASDPLFMAGGVRKLAAKPLQKAGKAIEAGVIGKGNMSLLKKEGLTANKAAENALKHGVGGSLGGHLEKIRETFDAVESSIDDVISKAQSANPNAAVNVDDAVNRVMDIVINNKDPKKFFGKTDEAVNAIQFFEDELKKYKFTGNQPIAEANQIKRIIGSKGFKSGMPSADTDAKELIADLLDLELKADIEKVVPEIKDLNNVYKELIPVQKMVRNRMPVADTRDPLGLADVVSLSQGNIPLFALRKAGTSGNVAQGLYNFGRNAKMPLPVSGTAATINNDLGTRKFGR
jgi:hypothetical protein